MKKTNTWFRYTAVLAVALLLSLALALVGCGGPATPDNGNDPGNTTVTEGPETGVYYFDAESGEYTIHLHSGNQFTLNDGVARVGTYTVSGESISFTFTKESNGTATATLAGDVLTLTYGEKTIRFIKKTEYTVTFNAGGGEGAPASVKVVNGRAIAAVADPTKAGYAFIGWYADEALTTPYIFGSTPITADTTLYAKWVEKAAGQIEYTVSFDGADIDSMTTIGGKLYGVPTPTKDGYTFGGWWISMTEKADELTAVYTEDTVFTANTTLFALWTKTEGEKLAAPLVSVNANGITWPSVNGASTYAVKITAPDGSVVLEENVSSTTKNFDFAVAGMYTVEVTAVSTNTANNSAVTVRCYNAKAINRVSVFEVIDSTLIFNDVGADKYYITIVCGNENHNHSYVSNGASTVYNFANCEMKAGGIEFTVTAVKNGYASSVSKTFVCEKKLDKVTDLTVNAATETLVWTPVSGATYYAVEINGTVNYVNGASYSLKGYTGAITVKVTPVSAGYISEATEYTYEKATLAAPSNIVINGNLIKWDAVAGAKSYTVKVNGKEFTATTNSLDLALVDAGIKNGQTVEISIKTVADGKESVYSDAVVAKSLAFDGELVYKNGVISWTPVIGKGSYEIKVNDGDAVVVSDANSYAVKFTKAGVNTVSVRFVGDVTTEWVTEEITVFAIIFDSRLGAAVEPIYVVKGDSVVLPAEVTRPGYVFNGWYNTPNASAGNGALYNDLFYTANDDTVLYADWKADSYKVIYNTDSSVQGVTNGETVDVLFNSDFTLGVPTSDKGTFLGWFTGPDGSGIQIADSYGKSTGAYTTVGNLNAYPFFEIGAVSYIEQTDGTWGVTAGPNSFYVENIIIPETYKGIKVTKILENGFKNSPNLKTLSVPNTVNLIGTGAFLGCYDLEAINVRVVEGNHDVVYSSHEGVLIRDYLGTSYLEYYPIARKGDFTVPANVDSIRNKAFQYADYLENLTISKEVTYIADQAFFHCLALKNITFEAGGSSALVIEEGAFLDMRKLETITLPARMAEVELTLFEECPKLKSLNVEAGGDVYGSKDGMLTNGEVNTILYTPLTISGDVTIPVGITAIGEGAFANRAGITSVTVSNKVESIGANAFGGCNGITSVTFVGGRNTDLAIGEGAFANAASLKTVNFTSLTRDVALDEGKIIIGASAFKDCAKLAELNFDASANIVAIGASAFANCAQLSTITIPATAANIGDSAFAGCSSVSKVEFAEGSVTVDYEFGDSVFSGCTQLRAISIPANVTKFPASAFVGCDNISEISVDADNPALYAKDGILYDKAQTEIKYYPKAKDIDFSALPATITTIGAGAFQYNPKLVSVTIPASITEIGANAFDTCINLTEVKFAGNGNIKIGAYAFANNPELKSIALPDAVTAISDYTFYMTALESFTVPASAKSIGAYALSGTNIATIEIPGNVEFIGDAAFMNCKKLTSATVAEGEAALELGSETDTKGVFRGSKVATITLAKRVERIGANAFKNVTALKEIIIPADSQLKHINEYAFDGPAFTAINLPEGLETIGDYAFYYVPITSVTIPSTVKTIGQYAFSNCSKLAEVNFTAGTAELFINDYAFYKNTSLVSIELPARLEAASDSVILGGGINATGFYTIFDGCTKLAEINVAAGCARYSSVDGVFYENNDDGQPATVIFCPRAKAGTVNVPATVTRVANLAFYNTNSLEKVIFADIENWDGVATLDIGDPEYNGWKSTSAVKDSNYAPFRSTSIVEVDLPVQLKALNLCAFYEMTAADLQILFDAKSAPITLNRYAIYGCSGMKTLNLPRVEHFGDYAVYFNGAMETLTVGKGSTCTTIGTMSVYNNKSLTAFEVPASVVSIDVNGISSNSALESLTFEEGSKLTSIGNNAFQGLAITEFVFPDTVTDVGASVFYYCLKLKTVTLPAGLTSLMAPGGGNILANASAISEIKLGNNKNMIVENGLVFDKNKTVVMYCLSGADHNSIKIPDTVTSIEDYSFYNFKGETLVLPASLVKIGNYAIHGASNLKAIVLPASVKTIGNYALANSMALETISFAEGSALESIGENAFFYCTALESMIIPDSVTEIGADAFRACKGLKTVSLPSGLKELTEIFSACSGLTDITIPEGVEAIRDGAFYNCAALESITIPASVHTIEYLYIGAFEGCASLKEITFAEGSKLSEIGSYTFKNCLALETIVLPEMLETIAPDLFDGCSALKSVTVKGAVTEIPANLFAGYSKLETVILPETVTTIGDNAFKGCSALTAFTMPAAIETVGANAFQGCAGIESISFGEGITSIGDYAFDGCSALASVTFDENAQIKALGNDPATESAIFRGTTALKSIALPATVTTIGANIFQNSGLETVDLPANLTAVSNYAFAGCTALTEVYIPETVKGIGDFVFADCSGLKTVELAFGVESIGSAAFLNCVALESINVPSTVSKIAGNPFVNCPSLATFEFDTNNTDFVFENGALFDSDKYTLIYYLPTNEAETYEIPESVREFAAGAFYGSQLKSISIPENMSTIADMLFMDSKKLETVVISKRVTSIGAEAFKGCEALKAITITESITDIGESAFAGCSALATVTFNERTTPYSIGAHAFDGCTSLAAIDLPEGLTELTSYMLANTGLVEFTIPEFITEIRVDGLFANNTKLVKVVIHDGVTGILGERFFYNCTALKEVDLGGITGLADLEIINPYDYDNDGIVDVGDAFGTSNNSQAFAGCTALESIDLSNIGNIGAYAFYGCTSLKEIIFAEAIDAIGDYAFAGCTSLVEVDMTAIMDTKSYYDYYLYMVFGANMFSDCTSLETVLFPNVAYIDKLKTDMFTGCPALTYIEIGDIGAFEIGATTFRELTDKTVVYCSMYTAAQLYDYLTYAYDASRNMVDNFGWFEETGAKIVGRDGSVLLPDHTICESSAIVDTEGNVTIGDYISISADGTVKYTLEFVISKYVDGTGRTVTYPAGLDKLPLGVTYDEEGNVYLANGTVINSAGKVTYPEGVSKLPAGISKNYYGAVTIYVDIVIDAAGNVTYPEGVESLPTEGITVADGTVKFDDGTTVKGTTVTLANGASVVAGVVNLADGTTVEGRYVFFSADEEGGNAQCIIMPEFFEG